MSLTLVQAERMRELPKVVILGRSTTSRIAYKLLEVTNNEILMIGTSKCYPQGLFYIHKKIAGITCEDMIAVHYKVNGPNDLSQYLKKTRVNSVIVSESSFSLVGSTVHGYQIEPSIWDDFINEITGTVIRIDLDNRIVTLKNDVKYNYDYLITSIPMPDFCILAGIEICEPFSYNSVYIYTENIDKIREKVEEIDCCFDTTNSPFYRYSSYNKGLYTSYEYSALSANTLPKEAIKVRYGKIDKYKDIETIAQYIPPNVLLVGRYASWTPREMAHDSYDKIRDFMLKNQLHK